jgi:hypothetical protein
LNCRTLANCNEARAWSRMDSILNLSSHELTMHHRGAIALTFDDWFVEEWLAADRQILSPLGLRATFFVSDPGPMIPSPPECLVLAERVRALR